MPYTIQSERPKFQPSIEAMLGTLNDPNDNPYLKGEFFGFFVNRFVRRFLGSPDYTHPSFNSTSFNEGKRKTIENAADTISAALNRSDPMAAAGDMNYAISAVYWGFLGLAEGHSPAKYGVRAYFNGIIDKIVTNIETVNSGSQKDATMAFRRHLVIRGVLDHVKAETYRRETVYFEDEKRMENGDVWHLGKLVLPSNLAKLGD